MSKSNSYLKKIKDLAAKNLQEGELFLAENALKDDVIVLPSGLQYEIIVAGDGKIPTAKDKVLCHYAGYLLNAEVFDSSYKRKKPESFRVNELIKGWQIALQLMPVGSKWKLFIPPTLAYGFEALTPTSGGNCTLIFEMELISIL
ncbi:FKBP-type peptidyl-prolyl cis-trans isomerase [Sphingobacterium rhinopitheci]|uniref:FKBP-type peptidyl-prolyl cis-trans isomerase n=1 Tax=Sphingobacterium rhinopitheci TaxID=2781960 RepID=UPI001F52042C|nr:FKBP-type peptidyl-prolyl cis-trans isomerase [Sphingobacterium rhinopitheci]MCI0921764.1 FKBP-type peptidyl-prolyl cis-trans isomerase [Sphingobacterium rhinopitheci]